MVVLTPRRTFSGLASILCIMVFVSVARAHDFYHYEKTIDRKQIGYTDIVDLGGGKFQVQSTFSNGKKIDGDHFIAWVIFYDAQDRMLGTVVHHKTVSPSFGNWAIPIEGVT